MPLTISGFPDLAGYTIYSFAGKRCRWANTRNEAQDSQFTEPDDFGMPSWPEARINDFFGSVERFKADFAAAQFGSGWCWLDADSDGSLTVTKTENGVGPLCFGQVALFGCDIREHSYCIDFRSKRPAYLANFLDNLVNRENVASRLPVGWLAEQAVSAKENGASPDRRSTASA